MQEVPRTSTSLTTVTALTVASMIYERSCSTGFCLFTDDFELFFDFMCHFLEKIGFARGLCTPNALFRFQTSVRFDVTYSPPGASTRVSSVPCRTRIDEGDIASGDPNDDHRQSGSGAGDGDEDTRLLIADKGCSSDCDSTQSSPKPKPVNRFGSVSRTTGSDLSSGFMLTSSLMPTWPFVVDTRNTQIHDSYLCEWLYLCWSFTLYLIYQDLSLFSNYYCFECLQRPHFSTLILLVLLNQC